MSRHRSSAADEPGFPREEPAAAGQGASDGESRWYTEHTALLISTLKWALLGAAGGACVGLGTRAFLWSLAASERTVGTWFSGLAPPFVLLPLALPLSVWLIRTFAREARGHGTEAVIAAVHERAGRVGWRVAPVKLLATVVTLAFGGSVGKEGPAAQIGASLTSLFSDLLRLSDEDRRRLVICGISGGFAAVFGTPVSGALFGVEVLYLGRLDYGVLFPALVAGIVAHLTCGVRAPFTALQESLADLGQLEPILVSLGAGIFFGSVAWLFIDSLRVLGRLAGRLEARPYVRAALGGLVLAGVYAVFGDRYAGLGTDTILGTLAGTTAIVMGAFLVKILATAVTLEAGGSGGIVTPIFFIGATSGASFARIFGLSPGLMAAFGFVAVLAAAANTPIAAAVMGIELLPASEGVYAALAAVTAFLMVGHRSVYASQRLGISKSAGLELDLDVPVGDVRRSGVRIRKGTLTERLHRRGSSRSGRDPRPPGSDRASDREDGGPLGH